MTTRDVLTQWREHAAILRQYGHVGTADLVERNAAEIEGTLAPAPALTVSTTPEAPEQLLDVKEAAARLGVTEKWVYRHSKTLPFARRLSPKALRFSPSGLERWVAQRGRGPKLAAS